MSTDGRKDKVLYIESCDELTTVSLPDVRVVGGTLRERGHVVVRGVSVRTQTLQLRVLPVIRMEGVKTLFTNSNIRTKEHTYILHISNFKFSSHVTSKRTLISSF